MISVANRISVAAGYAAEFERRFTERESTLREQPGFIRRLVLRPTSGAVYVVMTFWADHAAFERWTRSEDFRRSHARPAPPEMFSAPNALEIHDVVHQVEA
jgi:heme-degrading monooxygenase HmoA